MYVFVRTDISFEQQIVQACHSSIEVARNSLVSPCDEHPSVILLGVKSESHLNKVEKHLSSLGIDHRFFVEPDLDNQITSICTEPVGSEMRSSFRKYQCLKVKI